MYKVSTPKHSSLEMPTKHSKRDRGEEKLAVVQNTPRQQFEIDDTPEPTPDYDQVFFFFVPAIYPCSCKIVPKRTRSWKKKALNQNSNMRALVSRLILL